jgi:hypothetical protein
LYGFAAGNDVLSPRLSAQNTSRPWTRTASMVCTSGNVTVMRPSFVQMSNFSSLAFHELRNRISAPEATVAACAGVSRPLFHPT